MPMKAQWALWPCTSRTGGERPIFFYGQNYMGVPEAYLAAAVFHIFGASVFTLRLVSILLFALFFTVLARGLLWSIFVSTQAAAAFHCAWRLGSRRGAWLLERLYYARACLDISFAAAGVLLA